MKIARFFMAALIGLFVQSGVCAAADALSQDDVKTLLTKAVEVVKAQGIDAARDAFNKEGEFKFGEAYVTVIDFNGVYLVFPPRPDAVGKSVLNVKDADGRLLVQEMIRIARDDGEGWTDYRWLNPVTGKIQLKTSLIKRIPGTDTLAFLGIYK